MNELLKLFIIMGQHGVASGFDMFENDGKVQEDLKIIRKLLVIERSSYCVYPCNLPTNITVQ